MTFRPVDTSRGRPPPDPRARGGQYRYDQTDDVRHSYWGPGLTRCAVRGAAPPLRLSGPSRTPRLSPTLAKTRRVQLPLVRGQAPELPLRSDLLLPRSRNCRNPRPCLICPNTGSTLIFRHRYSPRPRRLRTFRRMNWVNRSPSGGLPLGQGGLSVTLHGSGGQYTKVPFASLEERGRDRCRPLGRRRGRGGSEEVTR